MIAAPFPSNHRTNGFLLPFAGEAIMALGRTHPEPRRATEMARLELAKLPADTRLADVFSRATALAAEAIAIERVGVWLFVEDRSALRCADLFERSKREHSPGAMLRMADFPSYFAALTIRKAIPAEVAATDPRTADLAAAYLTPLGITSMLDAGIFVRGELIGVVCHEHVGPPREWTTEDRDFAGSIADLLAVRIQTAEADDLRAAFRTQVDRLATLDKAESLQQMAAGLAHDFRNLLTVAMGNAQMLNGRGDLPADAHQQVRSLLAASERGVALVNELLDFARPDEKPPTVLNLADVTAEFLPVLRATAGAKHPVRYSRPPAVGQVLLDKGQFTRVLLNLTVNARDAQPNGGDIEIHIRPVRLPDGSEPSGSYVMVEVADRGEGMDEATRRRAFDPFFTTKSKGTGIGLAVVRRAVDRAGGVVRIEARPGGGTTLRVFFPRVGASSGGTSEYPALPAG